MPKTTAEPRREFDFRRARRGAIVPPSPGKTKISIRLDNAVLEHFRQGAESVGGGSYQTMINDALADWIDRNSTLDDVRKALREELAGYRVEPRVATPKARRRG